MKIRQIIGALESVAPLALQDGYDNAGLQIGLTEDAEASGVLLCLDVTEAVIDEAIGKGCNMIVSHHPLLFRPLKSISGKDYIERCVIKAIKNDITLYAAHTNLDSAPGGVNTEIAARLGLQNTEWLNPKAGFDAGEGLIGTLPSAMAKDDFLTLVKQTFGVEALRYNNWTGTSVQKVALCGGAGAFLTGNAIAKGADAFLTGEIGYHRFFGYENDILLLELGHYESEQYTLSVLERIIRTASATLPIHHTELKTNPINYK